LFIFRIFSMNEQFESSFASQICWRHGSIIVFWRAQISTPRINTTRNRNIFFWKKWTPNFSDWTLSDYPIWESKKAQSQIFRRTSCLSEIPRCQKWSHHCGSQAVQKFPRDDRILDDEPILWSFRCRCENLGFFSSFILRYRHSHLLNELTLISEPEHFFSPFKHLSFSMSRQ
jgi:hypothetical protein